MKILHVIHSANPVGGGPIEAIKQLTVIHEREGHEVEVASMDTAESPWVGDTGFLLHALGVSGSSYGYTPRLIPWLKERGRSFDVVVSHGLWQFNGVGVHRALRGSSTPYAVFPHGMLDPWFKRHYPLKHLKKWLYWAALENRVLRDAAAVLFTCEEERVQASRTFWPYACRERVVSFGTAAPPSEVDEQRAAFFARFPELQGKRMLLFLGRVHEKKGCRELLDAFRSVCGAGGKGGEPWHLVFAGPADSEYGREMQEKTERDGLAAKVTWAGMLSGAVKWGAFRAAQAFVLPSHQENFGIAVAEAMACSVPVLISNKVNIWREIERDCAGFVESDDLEGTIRLLERWQALTVNDRERMGKAARRSFEERFEIQRAAQDILGCLEQVAFGGKERAPSPTGAKALASADAYLSK